VKTVRVTFGPDSVVKSVDESESPCSEVAELMTSFISMLMSFPTNTCWFRTSSSGSVADTRIYVPHVDPMSTSHIFIGSRRHSSTIRTTSNGNLAIGLFAPILACYPINTINHVSSIYLFGNPNLYTILQCNLEIDRSFDGNIMSLAYSPIISICWRPIRISPSCSRFENRTPASCVTI
jgi:hypothetical protein